MYDTLKCVVKSSVATDDYATLFSSVCGLDNSACDGIEANGTTGTYGAYGMCNSTEQLGFAMNQYYLAQSGVASACSFGGSATVKAASTPTGCSAILGEAGTAGTGTVTSSPTTTGAGAGASSGTGSASTGTSTAKGAASGMTVPNIDFGLVNVGIYIFGAVLSGAAMILL